MNRTHLRGALLLAAASLFATGAYAQNPHAAASGKADKAADKADKAADKADKAADKADKAADKADKAADKAADAGKIGEDRSARKAKEHAAQREKLHGRLKGPIDEALKQELRRHAERLARLERIRSVATGEKDVDAVERATKLTTKETARHDRWMDKHAPSGATPTTTGTPAGTAVPAAVDTKGGQK